MKVNSQKPLLAFGLFVYVVGLIGPLACRLSEYAKKIHYR